ncbi:MAG: O-acetyl-ADP-ribose deacetylase [Acidimicrobiales bacterium]
MQITAWHGDITTLEVDAIVNAANTALARGSGVCGAIFAAAGPQLDEACEAIGHCDTGDAVATPAFDLPCRWVIHAVGPIFRDGRGGEPEQLASAYRRSLQVADQIGARSIAFPAISTGVYGFPPDEAARIAVDAVRSEAATATTVERVVLVAFDSATARRYEDLLGAS